MTQSKTPLALAALFALILPGWLNTLHSPFNLDDQNTILHLVETTGSTYIQTFPLQYRHLFYLSFVLNHKWGGFDPFGFHLVNLLIHILSSALVYGVVWITLKNGTGEIRARALPVAFVTAALFGLHPLQSEAVGYLSGRANSMSGMFSLLALLLYIAGSLKRIPPTLSFLMFYPASLIAFGAALLSKESAVAFPAAALVFDLCFMRGPLWGSFKRRLWGWYLPLPLLGTGFLAINPTLLDFMAEDLNKMDLTYALNQPQIYLYAVRLFFFPINLTFDYHLVPASSWFFQGALKVFPVGLVAGATIWAILNLLRKNAFPAFAILWFLIVLSPTNSLFPRLWSEAFSERNLYLPLFGFCLFLARTFCGSPMAKTGIKFFSSVGTYASAIAVLCVLSALLLNRNNDYRNPVALWNDTVQKAPQNPRTLHNLGHFYMEKGNLDRAYVTLNRLAIADASPFYQSQAHTNLGIIYARRGDTARAEQELRQGIAADSTLPIGYLNLGILYAHQGRYAEASTLLEEAEERYRLFRWGYPRPPELSLNKARIAFDTGRLEDAAREIRSFLDSRPESPEGYLLRGQIDLRQGMEKEALISFQHVTGDPEREALAANEMGAILLVQNHKDEAIKEFTRAVSLAPDLGMAQYNLGILLWDRDPSSAQARKHLELALGLNLPPPLQNQVQQLLASDPQ